MVPAHVSRALPHWPYSTSCKSPVLAQVFVGSSQQHMPAGQLRGPSAIFLVTGSLDS